jgi:hypothetical protein
MDARLVKVGVPRLEDEVIRTSATGQHVSATTTNDGQPTPAALAPAVDDVDAVRPAAR